MLWDIDWTAIPVSHTFTSVTRMPVLEVFVAWLATKALVANNDTSCSMTSFGDQSEELVYKQSRSQLDYNSARLIPWSKGKCLAWDVTMHDTHLTTTSSAVDSPISEAPTQKTTKYVTVASMHHFAPMAIKMAKVFGNEAKICATSLTQMHISDWQFKEDKLLVPTNISSHSERQLHHVPWCLHRGVLYNFFYLNHF